MRRIHSEILKLIRKLLTGQTSFEIRRFNKTNVLKRNLPCTIEKQCSQYE